MLGYGIAGQNALLNNYSLPVQLACDGLPAYATCTFVYSNPDPSDANSVHVGPAPGTVLSVGGVTGPCTVAQGCSGPVPVTMTITTNVPTGVARLGAADGDGVPGDAGAGDAGVRVRAEAVAARKDWDSGGAGAVLRDPRGRQWMQYDAAGRELSAGDAVGNLYGADHGEAGRKPDDYVESIHHLWEREPDVVAVHDAGDDPVDRSYLN